MSNQEIKEVEKLMEDLEEAKAERSMWEAEVYRIQRELGLLGVVED